MGIETDIQVFRIGEVVDHIVGSLSIKALLFSLHSLLLKLEEDERKEKTMKSIDTDRRNFIKKAGGSLLAFTAGSSLALSTLQAHAAASAITQTKQTQAAITPQTALKMLKDGNARFVQAVTDKNVVLTVERIRERSPILRGMVDKGQIGLVGAMYDVHNGKVSFMA